jgi:hypothetical protein
MKSRLPALALMLAGLGLTLTGILLGQPGGVLMKAARICMECVGLG